LRLQQIDQDNKISRTLFEVTHVCFSSTQYSVSIWFNLVMLIVRHNVVKKCWFLL